jgi:hypothetical protein
MRKGETKDLMGFLAKSAGMVSQRPPLWHYKRKRRSCRTLLCRSCLRPDISSGSYLLCVRCWLIAAHRVTEGGVVRNEVGFVYPSPEFLLVYELDIGEGGVFLWNKESAPFEATRARSAPCLVARERGV